MRPDQYLVEMDGHQNNLSHSRQSARYTGKETVSSGQRTIPKLVLQGCLMSCLASTSVVAECELYRWNQAERIVN